MTWTSCWRCHNVKIKLNSKHYWQNGYFFTLCVSQYNIKLSASSLVDILHDENRMIFLNIHILHPNETVGKTILQDTELSFHIKETMLELCYKILLSNESSSYYSTVFECYLDMCCAVRKGEMFMIKQTLYAHTLVGFVIYTISVILNIWGIVILFHSGLYSSSPFIYYAIIMCNDLLILTFKIGFTMLIFFSWDHHEFYLFELDYIIYTSKYLYMAFFEKALKAFGAWILILLYINKTRIILTLSTKVERLRNVIFSVLIAFILAITLHLPIVLFSKYSCEYTPVRKYLFVLFSRYEYWWYAVSAGLIPSIIIIGCNLAIVVKMIDVQYFKILSYPVNNTNKVGKHLQRQLLIGCVFIMMTSPSLLYDALHKEFNHAHEVPYYMSSMTLEIISECICTNIYSTNYAISVLLYCTSGSRLKKHAILFWRKIKLKLQIKI